MKKPNNWENVQAATERKQLVPGGYVCKIMDAIIKQYAGLNGTFEKLEISLEIVEGEQKGFFAEDYRAQTREYKKWRGVLRLYVPTDDGSEKDEWTQRKLKANINAIEDSNQGYHWDWSEAGLKGKIVGAVFRSEEWEYNSKSGFATQCFGLYRVGDIREGKFKIPDILLLSAKKNQAPVSAGFQTVETSDDDLPF